MYVKFKDSQWKLCFCKVIHCSLGVYESETEQKNIWHIDVCDITKFTRCGSHGFIVTTQSEDVEFKFRQDEVLDDWIRALTENTNIVEQNESDYEILEQIGSGGFGEVFCARHVTSNSIVAIKMIPKKDARTAAQFHQELNLLVYSAHPLVVPMLGWFETDTKYAIVMEYAPCGNLHDLIRNSTCFSADQKRTYLADIAIALDYLHRRGIVFNDLSSKNVLIYSEQHIKLCDFGLASFIGDHTMTGMRGTSYYIAPEMLEDQAYGFSVDWWSYGVLAYEVMIGLYPFRNLCLKRQYEDIRTRPVKILGKYSEETKDFLLRLLEKDPSKRLGCGDRGSSDIFEHEYFGTKGVQFSGRSLETDASTAIEPITKKHEVSDHSSAIPQTGNLL